MEKKHEAAHTTQNRSHASRSHVAASGQVPCSRIATATAPGSARTPGKAHLGNVCITSSNVCNTFPLLQKTKPHTTTPALHPPSKHGNEGLWTLWLCPSMPFSTTPPLQCLTEVVRNILTVSLQSHFQNMQSKSQGMRLNSWQEPQDHCRDRVVHSISLPQSLSLSPSVFHLQDRCAAG